MTFSRSYSFGTRSLSPRATAIGLGIVGLILLGIAGFVAKSTSDLQLSGIHAQGEVVRLERSESSYFPVFSFRDQKGRELTVRSSVSSKRYLVGDAIPIVYDPQSPLDAKVDEPYMLYLMPGVLGFMGFMFFFGTLLVLKLMPLFEKAYDAQRAPRDDGSE